MGLRNIISSRTGGSKGNNPTSNHLIGALSATQNNAIPASITSVKRTDNGFVIEGNPYMLQMIREVYPANKPKSSLSVVQQSHPVNGERRFALVTTENIGQPNEAITIDDTIGFVVSMRVNPDTTYKGKGFVGQIAFQKELNGNFEVEDIDAPVITVAPGAPTGVQAVAGDAQAQVLCVPPVNPGSSPITEYEITAQPGNIVISSPTPSVTFPGLTNGIAYTFTVRAESAAGLSSPSAASLPVTPTLVQTPPEAPTDVVATAGDGEAMIEFIPPANTGGSAITEYIVTSDPDTISVPGLTSPIKVTGLTNGMRYTFTVVARNAQGYGIVSDPSNEVVPAEPPTVPGAPTNVMAVAGDKEATIEFMPPVDTGGLPIQYFINIQPGNVTRLCGLSPVTIIQLQNGTPYTFTIIAKNALGETASIASNEVTPEIILTAPEAPKDVVAQPGNKEVEVSFTPPAVDGGSPITEYIVRSTPDGIVAKGNTSPIKVTGLTNGASYTFTVVAKNALGDSVASDQSNEVVPVSAPSAPTNVVAVAGNKKVNLSYDPPIDTGGLPVEYTINIQPGDRKIRTLLNPVSITNLQNGTAYIFTVVAQNAIGETASVASNEVTPEAPATVPGAPTDVVATAEDGKAIVTFTAPTHDGGAAIIGYTVKSTPDNIVKIGVGNSIEVSGLTNGTAYTFTVVAQNKIGNSAESDPSDPVVIPTPIGKPSIPSQGITLTRVDLPQPENIATETIKYKEFSTTYDELKNKANVLYTAFTEAKKETDPVMRRTKLRAIVSYKMENPTTHKKYTIKPLQGTDNKLLYLLVGVQSMIAALEAKKPLSDALLVEMQTLERNIILQRADMMQLSENVNAAIADIDASNPPSSVVSSKTRAEKDIAELQTSYDAIVLRNNEVISELTILQGEEKSPQRDTNTFSLRKKISILISDTNNILNAVKRNITKNIGDKDKTAQLKQTIVQSIDLLRQSLAESAKLLTTEAKKPAEKNPLKIVSLQEALNDMDKYHISVNPQKGYDRANPDDGDDYATRAINADINTVIDPVSMEEMINSFTSLPLMVKPDDGYELIQPGTNNYAVRGAIRLKDTIQKITTLDELKKQIERVGNIFDLMIVKKGPALMYAIRENGLMLSTNGIEDFAGDEKSLSEILADEDKAYMIIALPKHVGDTKKKRKKWLVDHAIQKYSEDNKTSISYLPLFLQAGFYSPNDKAFGLEPLYTEEKILTATEAIKELELLVQERDKKLKTFRAGETVKRTFEKDGKTQSENVKVDKLAKGKVSFIIGGMSVPVMIEELSGHKIWGTFEKSDANTQVINEEYNTKIRAIVEKYKA